ncbi:hypothetical protein, partial [Fulvivirga sp.]|uniref:hypothetical protein n=1 Tax=Fulvivirga sp. TaxID=1931237 RepID=UPI0032EC5E9F
MTKTALIFAYECAPYNRPGSTIGAQRPYQMAKYLSKNGWRTIVLTCDFKKRRSIDDIDQDSIKVLVDQGLSEFDKNGWTIIGLPSLKFNGLIDQLWWKFTAENPDNGTLKPKTNFFSSIFRKLLTLVKLTLGDHSQSWQPVAKKASIYLQNFTPPDIVIAEHGPDAGLFLGKWHHTKFAVPWVVDFRDPVDIGLPQGIRKVYNFFIKCKLKSSSLLVNVTPYWAKLDKDRFNKDAICVTNGFDIEEFEALPSNEPSDYFDVLYPGNVHEKQDIELFIEAFAHCINIEKLKKLRFVYCGGQYEYIEALLQKYVVKSNFKIHKPLSRQEALILMKKAALLLVMGVVSKEKSNLLLTHGLYPGKVFEYFGVKRPIILAPSDRGILEELIVKTRSGMICNSVSDVVRAIKSSYLNWERGMEVYKLDSNLTEE